MAQYVRDGQPVGSRTLARESGLDLSPATIRNVMSDLERLGLVRAPHTSAGRVPTVQGYRFFVDSLLKFKPLAQDELETLQEGFQGTQATPNLLASASALLSDVTHFVGLVTVPKRERFALRYVDFVPLSESRVLAVLVFIDGDVQNRLLHTPQPYTREELQRAANYLNAHYTGETLGDVKHRLRSELQETRDRMYRIMGRAIAVAERALTAPEDDELLLTGETNLMEYAELSDTEKLRRLFEAFHRKRELLSLTERCIQGEGLRLFIGEESGHRALGDCSVVTAPYAADGRVLGVLGVIGPTRMDYDRVIPVVDATARLLGAALDHHEGR